MIEGYMHIDRPDEPVEELIGQLAEAGTRKWVFSESIFVESLGVRTQNPLGMWLKKRFPCQSYFYAAADFFVPGPKDVDTPGAANARTSSPHHWAEPEAPAFAVSLADQVRTYSAIGADGWKLVNGKPDHYFSHLDSPVLEPLFAALEETGLPLFWHVGDPVEFWNPDAIPRWALKEWCYTDAHPSLDRLRAEAMRVLHRHPRLPVIFAHFYFMGYELDELSRMLAAHPNVYLDLTPGIEMYFGFTSKREAARRFFSEHADRIVVGSYASLSRPPAGVLRMIRKFLETDESFDPPHDDPYSWPDDRAPIKGIRLGPPELEMIYTKNLERLLGEAPRLLDEAHTLAELRRIREHEGSGGLADQVLGRWKLPIIEARPCRARLPRMVSRA